MTERNDCTFAVTAFVSGRPWIVAEPIEGYLPDRVIGFHLVDGITFEQANEIAAFMRKHIRGMNFTP